MWSRDHDVLSRLRLLRARALSPRGFERYYATLVPRYGDERGLGVLANLWDRATRRLALPAHPGHGAI